MNKIKKLDEKIANMIAAGEVVEKVANVVKELVENSIDALSTKITVELVESGLREIKIIDNGIGMNKEDALMAIERHATSKISNEYDLYHIKTLGFRGEAIPSIASVSDFSLTTNEGDFGYFVHVKGGKLVNHHEIASNKGTTILVKNLFYNTPARLKYVRSLNTELAYITDYFYKLSLSHPEIAFKLVNDEKVLLNTDGSNDLLKVINNIYGLNIAKKMKYLENTNKDYKINGYISLPEVNRSNRNYLTIMCNNRVIKNSIILDSIVSGYKTTLMKHRYPIGVINIICDPLLVDVNIHPSKLEVRFSELRDLKSLIENTVYQTINEEILIPSIEEEKVVKTPEIKEQINFTFTEKVKEIKEPVRVYETKKEITKEVPKKETVVITKTKKLPYLEYIGQFSGTYLLCQNEEALYIIDQHAAAERVRYEEYYQFLGNPNNEIIDLLIPQNLELSPKDSIIINDNLDKLLSMGITLEESGINSYFIKSIPSWIPRDYSVEFVENIVASVIKNNDITVAKIRDELAKLLSCKTSIKANKYINEIEIKDLLNRLSKCENPYTCPHGRPVLIKFTNYELEKLFKRVV